MCCHGPRCRRSSPQKWNCVIPSLVLRNRLSFSCLPDNGGQLSPFGSILSLSVRLSSIAHKGRCSQIFSGVFCFFVCWIFFLSIFISLFSVSCTASLAQWLRRPPRERKVPGSNPACAGIFSGSSHTSDLNIGTPVATLPGAWRYRVSAGTGRPGVSMLRLGEVEGWICNFCLSVAARKMV